MRLGDIFREVVTRDLSFSLLSRSLAFKRKGKKPRHSPQKMRWFIIVRGLFLQVSRGEGCGIPSLLLGLSEARATVACLPGVVLQSVHLRAGAVVYLTVQAKTKLEKEKSI